MSPQAAAAAVSAQETKKAPKQDEKRKKIESQSWRMWVLTFENSILHYVLIK
jgi:hypothetical protein